MDFDLPADHELIRRTVREFAEGEVAPVAEELDRTKAFPYAIVRQLGELGLMGIPFPEEYGGGGGDSLAYALAVEELTRVDSSVAITLCAHTSLGTQPIFLFGSEEQKREWLPELTSGRRLGAFGLTEPEAGSDADIGRIGVSAMGVGLAQGALDQALAYAKERRAFGQPISRFQAIQAKLADMATEIEAARLLTYKAAWLKDQARNFTITAAQAKPKTGRPAVRASEEAVQIHGGYGYIEGYPGCRFY